MQIEILIKFKFYCIWFVFLILYLIFYNDNSSIPWEILLFNGEHFFFLSFFFLFWPRQRGIFVSLPGIEPQPQHWKCWVLITGLPGNSQKHKEPTCQCRRHETWVWSQGREDPLEEGMATYSSFLAWRIPCTEEPGGLQSRGLQQDFFFF